MTWPDAIGGVGDLPASASPETQESYRILRSRIDLSPLPRFSRDVTEAVIHASADFDYYTDLVCDEDWLAEGVAGLAAGAPVIADSAMVAAGIRDCPVVCKVSEPLTQRLARTASIAPAAAAIRLAFGEVGPGACWVVGRSTAALAEILTRRVDPVFVVGLPAGFVGAAEAKDALRAAGVPSVSNVSEKGGPAVAVAAFGALFRHALAADRRTGAQAGQSALPDEDFGGW